MKNVSYLKIEILIDFDAQPFKVFDDEAMYELIESIKSVGILVPITVRTMRDGKYEIISGHRRKRACEIAGIEIIPAIIKELSDTESAIMLVDSNLQRERLLPSERAFAYRLKFEALKHQGRTSGQMSRSYNLMKNYTIKHINSAGQAHFSDEYYRRKAIEYISRRRVEKIKVPRLPTSLN